MERHLDGGIPIVSIWKPPVCQMRCEQRQDSPVSLPPACLKFFYFFGAHFLMCHHVPHFCSSSFGGRSLMFSLGQDGNTPLGGQEFDLSSKSPFFVLRLSPSSHPKFRPRSLPWRSQKGIEDDGGPHPYSPSVS